MSEPVSTPVNIAAGATAVTVSVGQSMGTADSLYRASWEQITTGNFNLIMADVLGLMSISVLLINLFMTIRREKKKR